MMKQKITFTKQCLIMLAFHFSPNSIHNIPPSTVVVTRVLLFHFISPGSITCINIDIMKALIFNRIKEDTKGQDVANCQQTLKLQHHIYHMN